MKELARRFVRCLRSRENVVYRYDGDVPGEPVLPESLSWCKADVRTVQALIRDDVNRQRRLMKNIAAGATGVIIHDGNHWAAHGLLAPPGVALPSHLPAEMVEAYWWLFHMHTRPEWRGHGLQKACTRLRLRMALHRTTIYGNNNTPTVLTDTNHSNVPSRRCFQRLGFEPLGVVRTLKLRVPKLGSYLLRYRWNKNEVHSAI